MFIFVVGTPLRYLHIFRIFLVTEALLLCRGSVFACPALFKKQFTFVYNIKKYIKFAFKFVQYLYGIFKQLKKKLHNEKGFEYGIHLKR